MKEVNCSLIVNSLNELGMSINSEQLSSICLHLELLLEWDKKINLTAITDEKEIIIKHIIDSIMILTRINIPDGDVVADIGTGAGFPGIPIEIIRPDIFLSLVESSTKKAEFIKKVIDSLELKRVELINKRVEDIAKDPAYREKYSLAMSRAVADTVVLAEYTLPLVKIGGHAVFFKSRNVFKEVEEAKYAIELLGGRVEDIANVVVPFLNAERYLVSIEKVEHSPQKYPRRAGLPAKRPLKKP
jgi:16S rRNA (guanine527-N7)-methyltransferase